VCRSESDCSREEEVAQIEAVEVALANPETEEKESEFVRKAGVRRKEMRRAEWWKISGSWW
jgi:hypothetical protein